jgi:hypothetical protein
MNTHLIKSSSRVSESVGPVSNKVTEIKDSNARRLENYKGRKLLIVTPTLGKSPFWQEMIASIVDLGIPYWHYIICPPSARNRLAFECPQSVVIAERPGTIGLYDAINQAMEAAAKIPWEWMTYINDDDVLRPGVVECLTRASLDVDVCYGRVTKIDEQGRRIEGVSTLRSEKYILPLAAARINGCAQQGTLFRRRIWEKIAPFDTTLKSVADFDLFVRAALAGAKLKYCPFGTGAFRHRAGQISQDVQLGLREKDEMIKKHGLERFRPQAQWAKLIFRLQNAGIYGQRLLQRRFQTSHQMLAKH